MRKAEYGIRGNVVLVCAVVLGVRAYIDLRIYIEEQKGSFISRFRGSFRNRGLRNLIQIGTGFERY